MLKWLLLTAIHLRKQMVSCSRTHLVCFHSADIQKLHVYIHVLRMRLLCLYFYQLCYSAMLKTFSNYAWGRLRLCPSHSILLIYGQTIGLRFTVPAMSEQRTQERNNESLTGKAPCLSGNCFTASHALIPSHCYVQPLISRQRDCTHLLLLKNLLIYAGIMFFRKPTNYAQSNASIIAASLTSMQ